LSGRPSGLEAAVAEGVAKALEGYRKERETVVAEPIVVVVVVQPPAPDFRIVAVCVLVVLSPVGVLICFGGNVENHIAAIIGLALAAVAIALTFAFRDVTPLQRQMLLALFALAGGAIATEIPGFLDIKLTLGEKTAIGAGGALGVFVLLYRFSAAKPPE